MMVYLTILLILQNRILNCSLNDAIIVVPYKPFTSPMDAMENEKKGRGLAIIRLFIYVNINLILIPDR